MIRIAISEAAFEAIMCDWLNLGLEDPRITGPTIR